MQDRQRCLAALRNSVIKYNTEDCSLAAKKALDLGIDPAAAVLEGLAKGMETVGNLFYAGQYFVPEVLLCADALYAGLEILKPHLKIKPIHPRITLVIGCVEGDVHEIGKNLVKQMFISSGWEVHDLGYDVPLARFVEKLEEVRADILAMSAMMTTTMMGMKKVIAMAKDRCPECMILLGGAPLNRDIAALFGADGYASSAGEVVREVLEMMDRFHEQARL